MASACSFPTPQTAIATLAAVVTLLLTACDRAPSGQAPAPKEVQGAPIKTSSPKTNPAMTNATLVASTTPSNSIPESSSNTATALLPPAAPSPSNPGQSVSLSFDQLAGYTFEVSDELLGPVTNDVAAVSEKTNAKIPENVKSFDRKKVALKGFMLPLKVEGGLVTEMLIMKDQSMCCYGTTPRINDWVSVKMKNKGVRPTMDLPVTLSGTMRIGEMRENGYLVGIYSMDGEEMDAPEVK